MNLADDPEVLAHLLRVETALFNKYDLSGVVRYLEEKTFLKGDRFSFKDHEFQKDILSDTSQVVFAQKCAQVGMSEAMARYALAVARVMPYFSVIMTMPFSGDAENFAKTRLDPIITETPDLRDSIDPDLDNTQVKGIMNSLLYMRGCSGTTSAISVPADMLIHDEVDRSDADTVAQYQSRIKHSKYRYTRKFGTPTIDGFGIALDMATARRKRHMCACAKCNHQFVPNFHTDVVIPGFDGDKREITKYTLPSIRWQEATWTCPKCGRNPEIHSADRRSWVIENSDANYEAVGYYIIPASVPNIVTAHGLVQEITKYKTWTEFVNQALGETANEVDSQLMPSDVENAKHFEDLKSGDMHSMGIDVGQVCHITIGRQTLGGELLVVHKERCTLSKLAARKAELKAKYRVLITVVDAFPETNLVKQMQDKDKNLFGGVYHKNRKAPLFTLKMVEQDLAEGKLPINHAMINRDNNFDEVMALYKTGLLRWKASGDADDELFAHHMVDMKRVQELDSIGQLFWTWKKSTEGADHYMHSLGYLHIACGLMPAASKHASFGRFPIAQRIKVATPRETRVYGAMR